MSPSRWVLPAWGIALAAAIVHAYPELVSAHTIRAPFARPERPAVHAPIHARAYSENVVLGEPTFEYRGGASHTGVAHEETSLAALQVEHELHDLNVGVHDASKASPAVDASGVYVGFDTGWIHAFDHDGKTRWRFHVAQASRGVHATAALDHERVYVGAYNGTFYALDKRTGEPAWAVRLGDTVGSSATIVGDALFVAVETFSPPDGFVAKLDRRDGKVLWQSAWLGEQSHSSPTVDVGRGLVFVGANDATFRALDIETGRERWRLSMQGPVKSTAALVDGTLYVTSMGVLSKADEAAARVGVLYAVDAETGVVRWQRPLGGHSRSSATVIRDEGLVVVGADDGALRAFDLQSGDPRWVLSTDAKNLIASATAYRDPKVGFRLVSACGDRSVCVIGARDGQVIERIGLSAHLTSVPTLFGTSVFLSTDAGGGLVVLEGGRFPSRRIALARSDASVVE